MSREKNHCKEHGQDFCTICAYRQRAAEQCATQLEGKNAQSQAQNLGEYVNIVSKPQNKNNDFGGSNPLEPRDVQKFASMANSISKPAGQKLMESNSSKAQNASGQKATLAEIINRSQKGEVIELFNDDQWSPSKWETVAGYTNPRSITLSLLATVFEYRVIEATRTITHSKIYDAWCDVFGSKPGDVIPHFDKMYALMAKLGFENKGRE